MSGERFERNYEVIHNSDGVVLSNWPIHFSGMCIFARNDSNDASVIRVHDSPDGTTWGLVLGSTHDNSGLLSVTIEGLSFESFLFMTREKYVRISLAANNIEGVYMHLAQWPPKPVEPATEY